jgi:hypothetical protein
MSAKTIEVAISRFGAMAKAKLLPELRLYIRAGCVERNQSERFGGA